MIYGSLHHPESQGLLEAGVKKVLEYANSHDLAAMSTGRHDIDGDDLFVNIIEYETKTPEERFWEAHHEYLDVHVPILKEEQIDLALLEDLQSGGYDASQDFQAASGDKRGSLIMKPGDFLVLYPQDVHRTAVAVNGKPEAIKKAVFKVRIR